MCIRDSSWSVFVYGHASPPVLEYPSSCAGGMLGVDNPGGAYSSYAYGTPEPSCDCSFSGTFHVPDWERAIPPFAFAGCRDLTAVTGMANVETVGADAFYDSGIQSFEWPTKAKVVPEYCFARSKLTSISNLGGVDTVQDLSLIHI